MPKIQIINLAGIILQTHDEEKTLLQHFHEHRLDWMHACGGKGRCTTCRVVVINGEKNMSDCSNAENKHRSQHALLPNERLTCQARVFGDIVIQVPEECKLPHIAYSD